MKILFHLGSGNSDRPGRWHGINPIFTNLGEALIDLGHDVHMMLHSAAQNVCNNNTRIKLKVSNHVDKGYVADLSADIGITWNGVSEGDQVFVECMGRDKMIFGELGFFGHYQSCYFDRCGVNARFGMIGEEIETTELIPNCIEILDSLIARYIKDNEMDQPFIFVPLQDETDTQITRYTPFKTMDEFLHHVFDIFRFDDRMIVYKQHPRAPSRITLKHPRVLEVKNDVHHYLPYADHVFGLNSTVMVETLLYHHRLITYGTGIASRHFENVIERKNFVATMAKRQFAWGDLRDPKIVEDSYLYKYIVP